ncbi:Transposable element P transposase [Paramuricea clavata]|uniref:Transposable element P transposase n=1 Tax=Paramuricea clavata TaxID=317549 RepID=A0A7D9DLZ1_PARCT|nr:Transposable element P transposase [Paramuricea clavata]
MKLLKSEKFGRRYHPQIIRFALSLHGKSPAAYREVRESGALILPSERALRDYKNYFKPKAGINLENIETLRDKSAALSGIQRYVVQVMDEMKIQSNLVFDKYSGDLIGFVDLGDPMTNASLGDEDVMATHALAFLVRGMCSDLKHVIAYYFTENVTSYQLISIFWRVVGVLEFSLDLWVCAAVNDGASRNR